MDGTFTKPAGTPHFVDEHVGLRVRLRRKELRLSQAALADAIHITFQQVQKYERGANRISASKLYEISVCLKTPITYFYEGLPSNELEGISTSESDANDFLRTSDGQELATYFARISATRRKGVLSLVRSLIMYAHTPA